MIELALTLPLADGTLEVEATLPYATAVMGASGAGTCPRTRGSSRT